MAPAAIPAWALWTAAAVSVAGTAYSAYSANQTSKFNEKVAKNEANYAAQKAELDENKHRDNLKKQMAQGRVAVAKAGVSLLSTTATEVFDENLEEGLFDAMMIRTEGKMRENSANSQAGFFSSQAEAAVIGGAFATAGTALTSFTRGGGGTNPPGVRSGILGSTPSGNTWSRHA